MKKTLKEHLLELLTTDADIEVFVAPDELEIRGNVVNSGDPIFDKEIEDEVIASVESGNEWSWAFIEVRASFAGVTGSDTMGGATYDDEEDFHKSGAYEQMEKNAILNLADNITRQYDSLHTLFWELGNECEVMPATV